MKRVKINNHLFKARFWGGTTDIQKGLYDAFRHAGFSVKQAIALTAEVGRENDYRIELIFGHHRDSGRWNAGMLSWNQARGTRFMEHMNHRGMVDQYGKLLTTQTSLNAQAEFVMHEMTTVYPKTKAGFLDKPDIDRKAAAKILGSDYIRWDMAGTHIGKHGAADAAAKRDKYYDQIAGEVS